MNKIMLVGRLGKDPELWTTQNGTTIATMSLATTEFEGGEKTTQWFRVVAFGKTAELAGQYLAKGRQVAVEGRMRSRQWEGQDGQRNTT